MTDASAQIEVDTASIDRPHFRRIWPSTALAGVAICLIQFFLAGDGETSRDIHEMGVGNFLTWFITFGVVPCALAGFVLGSVWWGLLRGVLAVLKRLPLAPRTISISAAGLSGLVGGALSGWIAPRLYAAPLMEVAVFDFASVGVLVALTTFALITLRERRMTRPVATS